MEIFEVKPAEINFREAYRLQYGFKKIKLRSVIEEHQSKSYTGIFEMLDVVGAHIMAE